MQFLDLDDGDLGFLEVVADVGGSAGTLEYHVHGDGDVRVCW